MRSPLLHGLLLVGLSACGGESPPPQNASSGPATPREVHFTAKDFAFEGPDTIEGGMITMVLKNEGPEWHHLQLVPLENGMTMEGFQEAMSGMQPGSPPPPWLRVVGGVNPPAAGQEARITMMVEPGEYAVLCFVDTPDFVPHVMKGMAKTLTVTAPTSAAPAPESDLSLSLVDYSFSFSAPPTAGSHVIRIENDGAQPHEIALFKLLPGKTVDDLMAWAPTYSGPAPVVAQGGVPSMMPGQVAYWPVTLTAGEYVALCFWPDANDGQMHLMHGMMSAFQIS